MLPAPVIVSVPLPHVKPAACVNEMVPVETVTELTFVADKEGVPATDNDRVATTSVNAALTLLGLSVRFPVPPEAPIARLPPAPRVNVVAATVAFPIVKEAHTAAVPTLKLIPELMTASSAATGI